MMIRFFLYILLLLCFLHCSYAQQLSIELPVSQEVRIGEEIRIKLNTQQSHGYILRMQGQPQSAVLEGNTFRWTPGKQDREHYLVTFQLLDSNQTPIDETNLSLHVVPSDEGPYLEYNRTLADTIKLKENESFTFSATIKSKQQTDARRLLTYFTFNENPNLRTFDSCEVNVVGDQFLFRWTPSNREALQEYLKFRITIMDVDQSIFTKVLTFHIQNINQPPHFLQELSDTIYFSSSEGLSIDFSAIDPDHDVLHYDYSPKQSAYSLQGTTLLIKPDHDGLYKDQFHLPLHLTLTVSDDHKSNIKRSVTLIRSDESMPIGNPYLQPVIGDFTKKVFSEGDSVLTYLNISNNIDLKEVDITYSDLSLPVGIHSLTKHLLFEKNGSYIKVSSKGSLPYSLVDRDYNYNISVLLTSKLPNRKPAVRVLVLTVENRPDPKSLTQQKDSLIQLVNQYLSIEHSYQSTLEKVRNRIHRPWWKNVAIATGTLSGVLSLIQIENPDKTVSVVAASISLLSILVTNIPSLSEKTLAVVDEKIANAKSRSERMQEKEAEFRSNWEVDMDQRDYDKMSAELKELINKSISKRDEDICTLVGNKKIYPKIKNLIKSKSGINHSTNLDDLFNCRAK